MVQEMQEMQDFAHINGYADNAWTVVTGLTGIVLSGSNLTHPPATQNSVSLCQ